MYSIVFMIGLLGLSSCSKSTTTTAGSDAAVVADTTPQDVAVADLLIPVDASPTDSFSIADSSIVPTPAYKLGFIGTVMGKVFIIDLATMKKLAYVGEGHYNVHGCGPTPGQKQVWYGNPDVPQIERFDMQGNDPTNWLQAKTVPSPTQLGAMAISAGGSVLLTCDGTVELYNSFQTQDPMNTGKHVAVFDLKTETYRGVVDVSPSFAVVPTADGSKTYVGTWSENKVQVLDNVTLKLTGSWPLPMTPGKKWGGPSGMTLSHDEKTLGIGGWDGNAAFFVDTTTGAAQAIPVGGTGIVHWAAFSPDDKMAYFSTFDYLPDQGNEANNVNVPSRIIYVDRTTNKIVKEVNWSHFVGHVGTAPGLDQIFVTASFGTVLRYDGTSGELTGQVQLYSGQPMPSSIPSF